MSLGTQSQNQIDYIEIPSSDLKASKEFYGAAFGWTFTDYGPDYVGIQKPGGGECGGLRPEERIAAGGPLVVLYSADLEATMDAVGKGGGRITLEPVSFPGGRRFHFADPSGNELAVWSER